MERSLHQLLLWSWNEDQVNSSILHLWKDSKKLFKRIIKKFQTKYKKMEEQKKMENEIFGIGNN